ncbi:MAG: alpha-L-rhamnosidase N-terminal domain-containing protein [Burkholderiales bacterium]|nr:alpha-L-rhamnosidase N-terminal domain-containing protein [Phycisphaerae bacterium]
MPALNESMIWTDTAPADKGYLHAGFRKQFELSAAPAHAELHIFAYTRYQLFINGEYVARGPNRFENERPEYDTFDVAPRLRAGKNVIAVLVHRDQPSGRVMHHAPGFTLMLTARHPAGADVIIRTDPSWQAFDEPTYGPQRGVWSSFSEDRDARKLDGDWTAIDFDSAKLPAAVKVNTADAKIWPVPQPRTIPHLRESNIVWKPITTGSAVVDGDSITLSPGGEVRLEAPQIVQAYYALDIDAEAGVKIEARPLLLEGAKDQPSFYTTRAGKQRWISGDTWAFKSLSLKVTGGSATLTNIRVVEVIYPFDRVGSFKSAEPLLDRIWDVTTRSVQLMSEDAYVDCADRERVEWMDCDPPAYDVTKVAFAGPGKDGAKLFSDARLMKNMLLRTALTQREDGMVKAHTCSDRWDIHAIMEDRACDWIEGLRKYSEATGDDAFIEQLWPNIDRFLNWVITRRSPERGLINAREWVAWDNPMAYVTCEGTANNAFFYRALSDGAFLAGRIGKTQDAARLTAAAKKLYEDFNQTLWIESAGAYASAAGTPELKPGDRQFKKTIDLKTENGLVEPTLHANLYALDRGIVPPERRDRVIAWVIAHDAQIKQIMANHFYFNLLYSTDTAEADQKVLDRIRNGWKAMAESPWGTTWEGMGNGSKVHIYGAVPGYTLSTYVLGVRRDAPVWEKKLIIQPRLADLPEVQGAVSTEFGLVDVSWKQSAAATHFTLSLPDGVDTRVYLPAGTKGVVIDGKSMNTESHGRWRTLTLRGGKYAGVSE